MTRLIARAVLPVAISILIPLTLFAEEASSAIDFVHDVVPIFKRNCVHCHGGREAEGDFTLNTRDAVLDSGFIDLDDPNSSYLLELITSNDTDTQMPPSDRPRMSVEEIETIRRWIAGGASWDADFTFSIRTYEPPLRPRSPELPVSRNGREHPIDRILDEYLAVRDLPVPPPVDDATFLRRATLDLIGLLPSEKQLDEFLANSDANKREKYVDTLLSDSVGYADHWLTFFNDLLRNDYSGTGFITKGRKQISDWLYQSLVDNKPFNEMARELIAPPTDESRGFIDGIKWRGEVSAGQTLPIQFSQSVAQSFLGINMKCASCHDSFIDRWTLKEAYGLAAIYATKPLELHRCDRPIGETAQAAWLFPELGDVDPEAPREQRLQQLADLMTTPENGRFARTIVNRLWYRLMGRGIVHPLDAMQTEPWNEDLLDYLATELVSNDFDLKHVLKVIATSSAYQSRSEVSGEETANEIYIYRGPRARRMTAEQFLDSVWHLTGNAPAKIEAPISRERPQPKPSKLTKLQAHWIWGPLENGSVPGGQQLVLKKEFTLADPVVGGHAVLTCDNRFRLYVNGEMISSGTHWQNPQSVDWSTYVSHGKNTIEAIVTNDLDRPNPAGFYFESWLEFSDGSQTRIQSDESWMYRVSGSEAIDGKLDSADAVWHPVTIVPALSAWTEVVTQQVQPLINESVMPAHERLMVRASLLKNTALMKSLGRPMREQIVSMRPDTITTLEAIDLANESTLAESIAVGAERLIASTNADTDQIVLTLFRSALSREPTPEERRLVTQSLGEHPDPTAVQDVMWAVLMLPEFLLVR
ncbi:DUF1549 domain-containing protein [Aporhodopirellula aestuarii]|uniref:DUF1553 domain-containing protein n=1 Tax=Aporhodopirellula aestuarii TaxID=2950107 RepID=A0ABT0UDZ8_9BACT|nr:DUF1549 domain-containing protein [Aporhodopirellula aestuarii]MCM2374991.1 DUF1553 domain-containing protein [Aporhodopirellula aestuarii]